MRNSPDRFSAKSEHYKKYRPDYPLEMLEEIVEMVADRSCCWDCGTGNGQVARVLSRYFKEVHASDISKSQIARAYKAPNIEYHISRAEKTLFKPNSFNLITVAQALHWFDTDAFFEEVRRVASPDGILAVWGYGLLRFGDRTDLLIDDFYKNVVGPFWDPQRKHVEEAYGSISFPFKEVSLSRNYQIRTDFNLDQLAGYLNTWSSVRNFIEKKGFDPVNGFIKELESLWQAKEVRTGRFPIFYSIGIVEK